MASCTKSGYRWCWEDEYCSGPVCAQPRIYWQFEDSDGNDVWDTYPYCYGDLYIRSGYSGTFAVNGYGFYNAPSWDSIWNRFWVDEYGVHINIQDYDFTPPYNGGRIKVASVGQTFTKCVALVAYDWNTDGDYWVATGTGYGWVGDGNCVSIQCVERPPDYQYYDVDGTPSGAEIWEGSNFYGVAGMTLALSYTDHYLTFKKSGYYDQTIHVGTKPGGETIYVRYSLNPITFTVEEIVGWESFVPAGSHTFYLFSFYGINNDNTPDGFEIYNYNYLPVTTQSMSRQDIINTSDITQFDCMTLITEFDGSTITKIYDWRIDNNTV